ncbi:TPA: hypothetical protein ACISZ9_004746 [Salmonella enterica subsp. enterica serovar Potsdam]
MKNTFRLFFFCGDPKKASPGSSSDAPARSGEKTQDVPLDQMHILLYVVLTPLSLTRRTGPEKTALLIP